MDDSTEMVVPSTGEISTYNKELWTVPSAFIPDPDLRALYEQVAAQLRADNPDADALEQLMMERVAALYMFLRHREATGDVDSMTAYHKNLELWAKLVDGLRKKRVDNAADDATKQKILTNVGEAFQKALTGLEPEVSAHIRKRFAENIGKVV